MLIGIQSIDRISEEDIWHPRFDGRLEKYLEEILCLDDFIEFEFRIFLSVRIENFEICPECVLDAATVGTHNFVWIHEGPFSIFFDALHEEIWDRDGWEEVECLRADISGLGLHIEEVIDITMPDVERDGDSTETRTELVYSRSGIIDDLEPWEDSG